jgi:YihY family inner membrane protein
VSSSKSRFTNLKDWLKDFGHELINRHLFLYASAISFNVLLMLFPALFLILSGFAVFISRGAGYAGMEEVIKELSPSPQDGDEAPVVQQQIQSLLGAFEVQTAFLWGAVAFFLILVYTLFRLIQLMLNELWDLERWRSFTHATARDAAVFAGVGGTMTIVLLATLILSSIVGGGVDLFGWQSWWIAEGLRVAAVTAPPAFLFIAAFLMYRFLPSRRCANRVALAAAAAFVGLWIAARYLLGSYLVDSFQQMETIYGVFALVIILSTWVYYSSWIFVVSAIFGGMFRGEGGKEGEKG